MIISSPTPERQMITFVQHDLMAIGNETMIDQLPNG